MKLLGIALRRPSFDEITTSAVMACGMWLFGIGVWNASGTPVDPADAGGLLLIAFWGCVCVRFGIRLDHGPRHVAAHVAVGAALLLLYQAAIALLRV